jgi:hypothetical protein
VLDDIVLKEDIPKDWAKREAMRENYSWPNGDVARPRVRVRQQMKPETFVRRIKVLAEVVRMLYNPHMATQLEELAPDFGDLAEIRQGGDVEKYPLVVLAAAFEFLMFRCIIQLRQQASDFLLFLEIAQKDTRRPHVFTNLRMMMLGRDPENRMAWVWPSHFMLAPHHASGFHKAWEKFQARVLI